MKDFDKKINWLMKWTEEKHNCLTVLDTELVDDYIKTFNVKHEITMWGANKCRDLGHFLSLAHKKAYLSRGTINIEAREPGFPKWVYAYQMYDYYVGLHCED